MLDCPRRPIQILFCSVLFCCGIFRTCHAEGLGAILDRFTATAVCLFVFPYILIHFPLNLNYSLDIIRSLFFLLSLTANQEIVALGTWMTSI